MFFNSRLFIILLWVMGSRGICAPCVSEETHFFLSLNLPLPGVENFCFSRNAWVDIALVHCRNNEDGRKMNKQKNTEVYFLLTPLNWAISSSHLNKGQLAMRIGALPFVSTCEAITSAYVRRQLVFQFPRYRNICLLNVPLHIALQTRKVEAQKVPKVSDQRPTEVGGE